MGPSSPGPPQLTLAVEQGCYLIARAALAEPGAICCNKPTGAFQPFSFHFHILNDPWYSLQASCVQCSLHGSHEPCSLQGSNEPCSLHGSHVQCSLQGVTRAMLTTGVTRAMFTAGVTRAVLTMGVTHAMLAGVRRAITPGACRCGSWQGPGMEMPGACRAPDISLPPLCGCLNTCKHKPRPGPQFDTLVVQTQARSLGRWQVCQGSLPEQTPSLAPQGALALAPLCQVHLRQGPGLLEPPLLTSPVPAPCSLPARCPSSSLSGRVCIPFPHLPGRAQGTGLSAGRT